MVVLQAFSPSPSSEGDYLRLLCPVRAQKMYVDRSSQWHQSLQLLVFFGAGRKGLAASKHTISHWVRDAISLAYEVHSLPSPLDIRAHSTRGVASSTASSTDRPLPIHLCGYITLMWTQLLVCRLFLLEPAVFLVIWSVMGQIWQCDRLCVWYIVPTAASYAALSYLWKRTFQVTYVALVLWVGNKTLRLMPSSSCCRHASSTGKSEA